MPDKAKKPQTVISAVDEKLASAALRKTREGKVPHGQELAALKRVERAREETQRWDFYRTVSMAHYAEMTGRQPPNLKKQAALYGIPCSGPVIDLTKCIRWLHDTVSDKKFRRFSDPHADARLAALERYRTAAAEQKEMELAAQRGEMFDLATVKALVGACTSRLVQCLMNVENSIGSEFAVWLTDPAIQTMPAELRARKVREFVGKTCAEIRRQEAMDIREMMVKQETE